jgi:hypothetical protein
MTPLRSPSSGGQAAPQPPAAPSVPLDQVFIRAERMPMPVAIIQELVAGHFGIDVAEMRSRHNARRVTRPRQVAMVLADSLTGYSLTQIGRCFDRDHTTVMHAKAAITKLARRDFDFDEMLKRLHDRAAARLGDRQAVVALDTAARDAATAAVNHFLDTLFADLRAAARRNPFGLLAELEKVKARCEQL